MYLKFSELFPMVFETWWHVCRSLHQKLPLLFDEVVFGLIKLCVGGSPAFLAEGSGTDVILSTVNVPFTGTSSPIFVLNEKLRKIPFVLMELPKRAITKEVLDNFFDLLKCVLSDGKEISGGEYFELFCCVYRMRKKFGRIYDSDFTAIFCTKSSFAYFSTHKNYFT